MKKHIDLSSTEECFKGTDIKISELTKWIQVKYAKYKVTEIRYFGSRITGSPRKDSDIDVYILFKGRTPDRGPLYTEIYKHNGFNYQIEFHSFVDFGDGYVPSYLIGNSINQL